MAIAASRRRSFERLLGDRAFGVLPDGTTVLTVYFVVLYAIPSSQRIAGLGSLGSVATLLGLAALIWWCWFRIQLRAPVNEMPGNPVRAALVVFVVVLTVSYILAMTRPLPGDEVSPADSGMIRAVALVGIAIVGLDGPPSVDRLFAILRRFAYAGGLVAALGLLQFVTHSALIDAVNLPGFTVNPDYSTLDARGGLTRPSGTAAHPLEYATVLSMAMPIAITSAIHAVGARRVALWATSVLVGGGILLSSSRSALIGLAVAILPLLILLPRKWALGILSLVAVMAVAVFVTSPLAFTNVLYLFQAGTDDASAASRSNSLAVAVEMFTNYPVFGRGFGTLLTEYRIFDNEYVTLLVEIGAFGIAAVIGVLLAAVGGVLVARSRTRDDRVRDVGAGLVAAVLAGGTISALFDSWAFPQAVGTLFLVVGLCGAYRRLLSPVTSDPRSGVILTVDPDEKIRMYGSPDRR